MVAIGGWGDNAGFSTAAASETSRSTYAKNVAAMLESTGLDGVGRHLSSHQYENLANTIFFSIRYRLGISWWKWSRLQDSSQLAAC